MGWPEDWRLALGGLRTRGFLWRRHCSTSWQQRELLLTAPGRDRHVIALEYAQRAVHHATVEVQVLLHEQRVAEVKSKRSVAETVGKDAADGAVGVDHEGKVASKRVALGVAYHNLGAQLQHNERDRESVQVRFSSYTGSWMLTVRAATLCDPCFTFAPPAPWKHSFLLAPCSRACCSCPLTRSGLWCSGIGKRRVLCS